MPILFLVKVTQICDHWSTVYAIQLSILNLYALIVSVYGPNFGYFYAGPDPDQTFHLMRFRIRLITPMRIRIRYPE